MPEISPIKLSLETNKTYYWCSCGRSAKSPFCDGSHAGSNRSPKAFSVQTIGDSFLCRCGRSLNAPYCDGSHSKNTGSCGCQH